VAEPFTNQDPISAAISEEINTPEGEVIPPARSMPVGVPFVKGRSGNPSGRPKSKLLTNATTKILGRKVPADTLASMVAKAPDILKVCGKRPTFADILAYSNVQQAIRGNASLVSQIYNRVEGRVPKEITAGDAGQLDMLMEVLAMAPAQPGEVNE
jgi:hypothetical protein